MANLDRSYVRLAWYVLSCLLAAFTYFYALDSHHAPKNGDENVYAHITRLTAASGEWLPLQSQLDDMRNTKPPLLMWQGIASTNWGKDWDLWNLRYPSVLYTLLTATLLFLLGRKLSGDIETGFIAALTWLAFFTTYRYGRPFLTNPPEVFWLFLPFFTLLYWRAAFESRFVVPLLFGICIGVGFLYKSFALALPITLALAGWYLHHSHYRLVPCLKQDAHKVALAITVALALFALWFVFDPDPQSVWREFVVAENAGKFDPHGPGYLQKLLWGGASIWSYTLAFLSNAGLLTIPVIALCFALFKRRRDLQDNEILLLLLLAAFFISFALPSQRSGRYMLDAMPALALLCALNWRHIGRWAFIATFLFAGLLVTMLAHLATRLQDEMNGLYSSPLWLLFAVTIALALLGIVLPRLTRPLVNVVALLVLLCLAAFLRPFDGSQGSYSIETQQVVRGKDVWVPCDFRASYEGHRFLLPGTEVHGYHEALHLSARDLSQRFPLFAVQVPLDQPVNGGCDTCKIIGQRLDIRGRQSSAEIKKMFGAGKVYEYLFTREVLMVSPGRAATVTPIPPAQECH